jgi:hypothetical protein
MTTLKTLTIVTALLAGGTSLAMAQGPATGGEPPVAGGAGGNPILNQYGNGFAAPTTAPARSHTTRHHRRMYMQANRHHGSKVTGSAASMNKFRNNTNTYR